jgi:hypothetical protein
MKSRKERSQCEMSFFAYLLLGRRYKEEEKRRGPKAEENCCVTNRNKSCNCKSPETEKEVYNCYRWAGDSSRSYTIPVLTSSLIEFVGLKLKDAAKIFGKTFSSGASINEGPTGAKEVSNSLYLYQHTSLSPLCLLLYHFNLPL